MLRGTWASGVGLLPLLLASALPAQTGAQDAASLPRIDWLAPRECPDADAVSLRLRETLDGELLAFGHDWHISGRVSADGASAWRLVLELSAPDTVKSADARQRVLRAARCDDLADAAAVAIAIALGDAMEPRSSDGGSLASPSAATDPRLPEPTENDVATSASEPEPVPGRARARLDLSLGALLDSATLGAWSVGGTFAARGWLDRLGLGVHGVWLPPHSREIARGQGAELSLLGGGVRACFAPVIESTLRLATCAGVELGRFDANGHGLVDAARLQDLWLAPSVGADVQGRVLGDLGLSSRLELLLPLERREYRVDLDQPVHDTPRLTFRWVVGVSTDFVL
jgi:hypothetical protein